MPCGVIMFDACSLKQILVNKKYNEIWQVSKAGLELTEDFQPGKIFHTNGRLYQIDELPIFRSINNGEIVSNEEMICQRKNGSIMNVICNSTPILDRNNNIVAGVIVFSDITELKEATTKAAIANQLQKIIEFLPDGIFVVDHQRKVIAWNRALEMLTGVQEQDVIGAEIQKDIFKGLERLMFIDNILNGFNQENESLVYQSGDVISKQVLLPSLNHRDNVLLDIKATPIRNEQGSIVNIIEIVRDITHQREMELEAIRLQKLESLGILAGGIAHDFNNILAAIIVNLQLAEMKLQKGQDILKNLKNTIETTRKASSLTKQLLTFAKGGAPIKKMVSLSKLVRETVNFALCGSNIKAVFQIPENLWMVDADEGQIIQVINNLIINAEQAMIGGGTINIIGENVTYDTDSKYEPGRYVKLIIIDHGEGIPEEIIGKIFDPFFTTKTVGSGLGLSTSYSIIKKHDGYLELEASSETGSTFMVLLPIAKEKSVATGLSKKINIAIKAKVLLLDDEDVIRTACGELLSLFGYQVVLAREGREAVELYQQAKEAGEPFMAIVMDLTIPGGMGGLETMSILRRIDPDIKAIISSGYTNDPVIADYKKYGFSGVVIKPYKVIDLLAELEKIIE
jgi:PAS domain S-box-containing protein